MSDERIEIGPEEKLSTGGGLPRGVYVWAILGVVLLAVLAAAVVPPSLLRHRLVDHGPTPPVASLRATANAQNHWRQSDYDGNGVNDYTPRYRLLYYQIVDGKPVAIIDKRLADASGPKGISKNGYRFIDMTGDASGPYDYKVAFGICGYPAKYKKSGIYTYITNEAGTFYGKDNGGEPVTVWPKDPEKEGWLIAQ